MTVEWVLTIAKQRGKHHGTFQQNYRQPVEITYEPEPEPPPDESRNEHRFPTVCPRPYDY
jgi:hypothetical protein